MKFRTLLLAGLLRLFSNVFYYFIKRDKRVILSRVNPAEFQEEKEHDR